MGDSGDDRAAEAGEEEQAEEVDAVAMEEIRQALLATTLRIGGAERIHPIGILSNEILGNEILSNARSFVNLSQGNDTVQEVVIYQCRYYHRDYETLRMLGEVVGNLEALQRLTIYQMYGRRNNRTDHEDPEVAESLYWQAFAGVLGRVRHPIELRLDGGFCDDEPNYLNNFAVAIQSLPTIRTFHSERHAVQWRFADTFMSTLASLPSLENVTLGSFSYEAQRPPHGDLPGLTNLLKSSSLRSIEFSGIEFTGYVSWALQAAFEEGSFVNNLRFTDCQCVGDDLTDELDTEEADNQISSILLSLVQTLQRNSSVKSLSLVGNEFRGLFCDGISTTLLVNTTLVDLTLLVKGTGQEGGGRWLQSLFIAMRINTSLKSLAVDAFHLADELVCGALRDMLAQNPVLESLTLHSPEDLDDTSVVSWRKTLPFIRNNESLKSLTISFNGDAFNPPISALCFDTVAMLEGNTTLECLDIKSDGISPGTYISVLESLQPSTTLKTLRLPPVLASMSEEDTNQVVSLVKKNYSLAVLDEGVSALDKTGDLGTLLRLNQAGRRYLIKDAASIAKGVEVLIDVRNDLSCLFYHLLENPTLCDIEHQHDTKSVTSSCAHLNKRQRI
jgi:hypothetical protein